MSDAVVKDQPEVAAPAAEAQPAQETAPAAAATTEQAAEKVTDPAPEAQKAEDKSEEKTETKPEEKAAEKSAEKKTEGKTDPKDFKKNRKYDPTTQPVTDDPVKIRTQVEFYFSDSNLPTDKFMWENTGGEANKPMPLKTICNFKRMRQFQPYSAIVAALRDSEHLEVSGPEGEEMVKRKRAYVSSTEAQKARLNATVYVKGFGEETKTSQFDIEAFFANYGRTELVKLRRTNEEVFKGSVFVQFATPELADAFVKLDPPPTWKGQKLLIMKKQDYLNEKNRQIQAGEIEPNTSRRPTFFEGRERGARGRGGGRGGKSDNSKKGRDGDKNGHKGGWGGRGRGRGRGGRGGGGGGNGRNGDGKDSDKKERKTEETRQNTNDVQMPTIQSTTNGTKRVREDDGASAAPPAKKVDAKTEA
ncbi:hypothetical protein VTK26DRAFT_813 [Humicola hyalothermophila]